MIVDNLFCARGLRTYVRHAKLKHGYCSIIAPFKYFNCNDMLEFCQSKIQNISVRIKIHQRPSLALSTLIPLFDF